MGYNTSIGPPRRMEEYLNRLLENRETVDFAADDPPSLAYKLREAIHASGYHDRYEHFEKLGELYEFKALDGRVRARYIGPEDPDIVEGVEETPPSQPMTIQEAQDLTSVVGAAMEVADKTDEIRFPNAILGETMKERLYGWATENGWKIIDHEEAGITLTKRDVADSIVWRPEDE